jgi:aspartyl-tRNA(Asn)/glutamyl-tRNA(Gln) amidotransferase subunit A
MDTFNAIISKVDIQETKEGKLANWTTVIKDNVNIKGTKTTAGSKYLENHISIYSASFVQDLLDAGAHIIAKTSLDELSMGGTNRSAYTGLVRNPLDETRISGGSSGGSAALVGAKMARLGMGSDTGDSVRKPASFCGIVGVKPTYGLISRYGVIPYAASLDHVAYFTQNVQDAALALEVLAKHDAKDMTSLDVEIPNYSELLDLDLKGKRVGVFSNVIACLDNDTLQEDFKNLLAVLESKGAIIVEKTMDQDLARAIVSVYMILSNAESVSLHANLDGIRFGLSPENNKDLESLMTQARSQGIGVLAKERMIYGAYCIDYKNMDAVYQKATKVRRLLVNAYQEMLVDVDVIIAPASSKPATKIEAEAVDQTSDNTLIAENYLAINNITGTPSITIPFTKVEDMPVGLNISAKALDEVVMFKYAKTLETLIESEVA